MYSVYPLGQKGAVCVPHGSAALGCSIYAS